MEDNETNLESLVEKIGEYGRTSIELTKLKTLRKTATVVSTTASRGTAILLFFMCIIIVNIGVSLWLGELLGKIYYGFFCIGGFYGLVGLIAYYFLHNQIKTCFSNLVISQFANQHASN